jgi:hypothetical protein
MNMMGNKLNLLFWQFPETEGVNWHTTLAPDGVFMIKRYTGNPDDSGVLTFDADTSSGLIEFVMTSLGFTKNDN